MHWSYGGLCWAAFDFGLWWIPRLSLELGLGKIYHMHDQISCRISDISSQHFCVRVTHDLLYNLL